MRLIIKCKAGIIKGRGGSLALCNPLVGALATKDAGNARKLADRIAGRCGGGPFNGFCGPTETFRGCLLPWHCPFPGDTCSFIAQPCFDDNGVVGGTISATGTADVPVNDTARPTVAAVFCFGPVGGAAVNAASGFPGAGRVTLAGEANGLP